MDKCSCLNSEALTGVLKTIYLFLEGQNFRATCETFLSESRGMGYAELKKAIACILVLKPSIAEVVKVSHADPAKNELQVQADWVQAMAATGGSASKNVNVFYGEPLCMKRLDFSLSSPDLCGKCPCSAHQQCSKGGGLQVVETIDNTKNDIETQKILKKAVQEEIKIAPPPPPEHEDHHILFKESPQVSVISKTELDDVVYPEQAYQLAAAPYIQPTPSQTSSHPSILNEEEELIIAEDYKSQGSATSIHSTGAKAAPIAGITSATSKTPSIAPSIKSAAPSVHSAVPSVYSAAPSVHSAAPSVHSAAPSGHSAAPSIHSAAPTVQSVTPSVVPSAKSPMPSIQSAAPSAAYSIASSVPSVLQRNPSITSYTPSITPSTKSNSHPPSIAQTTSAVAPLPLIQSQVSAQGTHASTLSLIAQASVKGGSPQERALTAQSSVRFDMGGKLVDTKTSNIDSESLRGVDVQQSVMSTPSGIDINTGVPDEPSARSFYSTASQPSAVSEMQTDSKLMSSKATVCERCSTKQVGLQIGNCLQKDTATDAELGTRSTHTATKSSSITFSVEQSASAQSFRSQYSLDFNKIKKELRSGCPSVRVMLLQALRWRITQTEERDRNQIITDYARHDLLSLHGTPSKYHKNLAEEFLCTTRKKILQEHEETMARMINAMASLTLGRDYLCQDETLLTKVIIPLVMDTHPSKSQLTGNTKEYLLVVLQKLSLRNNMRLIMIQNGLAEYIVSYLSTNHNSMSDYCLEYCLALFMNLSLHSETHARLKKKSRDVVKFMSDFLSAGHDSCLSYLNGAMYSLFMDADIRKEAKHGHLDSKISEKSKAVDDEIRLQMEVIMDILNTNKSVTPCGQCECIDQDDEIDHLEPEIEEGDTLNGNPNGENLLSLYRPETFLTEPSFIPLTCLCRPATPCKKITAAETCTHVDLDADLSQSPEREKEKKSKKSSSCFAICRKNKQTQNALNDDEKILASEECPRTDTVCCEALDDESVPVRDARSASVQKSMTSHVSICPSCKCLQTLDLQAPAICSSARQPSICGVSGDPSAFSGQGSAISGQASAISGQPSAVSRQASVLSRQASVVSGQPSEISKQPSRQASVMSRQASVMSRQASVTSRQSALADIPVKGSSARSPSEISRHSTRSFHTDQMENPEVWATSAQQVSVSHPSVVTHVSTCMQCCASDLEQAAMPSHVSVIGEEGDEPELGPQTSSRGVCPALNVATQPSRTMSATESRTVSSRLPPCSSTPSRIPSATEPAAPKLPPCSLTRAPSATAPEEPPPEDEPHKCPALPPDKTCSDLAPNQRKLSQGALDAAPEKTEEQTDGEEEGEEKKKKGCRLKCGKSPKSKDDKSKNGREGSIPPSFTRTVINSDTKGRGQRDPCDPCRISGTTCQPQNSCYINPRPYCYDTTSQLCRNQYCPCPNPGHNSSQSVGRSSCSVTQGGQNRNRYMCECYKNMKEFVQNTDVSNCSNRCPKRSDGSEDPKEMELSTPERELRDLQLALIQTDNFCTLDTSCIFSMDCECYDSVFQSRPKLSRTP